MSCLQEGHATEQLERLATKCSSIATFAPGGAFGLPIQSTYAIAGHYLPGDLRCALKTTNTDGLSAQEVTLGSLL